MGTQARNATADDKKVLGGYQPPPTMEWCRAQANVKNNMTTGKEFMRAFWVSCNEWHDFKTKLYMALLQPAERWTWPEPSGDLNNDKSAEAERLEFEAGVAGNTPYYCVPVSKENRWYYEPVLDWAFAYPPLRDRIQTFNGFNGHLATTYRIEILLQVIEKAMQMMRAHHAFRDPGPDGIRSLRCSWVGGRLPAAPPVVKGRRIKKKTFGAMDIVVEIDRMPNIADDTIMRVEAGDVGDGWRSTHETATLERLVAAINAAAGRDGHDLGRYGVFYEDANEMLVRLKDTQQLVEHLHLKRTVTNSQWDDLRFIVAPKRPARAR